VWRRSKAGSLVRSTGLTTHAPPHELTGANQMPQNVALKGAHWTHCHNIALLPKHTHSSILRSSWILSGTTQVSRHQKGKTNLDLLEQEVVSGNGQWHQQCLHLDPDTTTTPPSHHSVFYRPDALFAAQQCQSTCCQKTVKTEHVIAENVRLGVLTRA